MQIATSSLENESLRSQIVILNKNGRGQHRKYLPYVFTEQGIAMLSGLLRNEIAIKVSISIMNAFVEMRKFIVNNGQIFERLTTLEYKQLENEKNFDDDGTVIINGGYLDIGINDTMKDLIVNFIGAVCFSFLGYLYIKNRDKYKFATNFITTRKDN